MTYDFANDPKLAGGIGDLMQRAAKRRAAHGLASADGQVHRTAAQKAAYDNGVSLMSRQYAEAGK